MLSFFTTVLTGFLAVTSSYAVPVVDIAARSAYVPAIVAPDANTFWSLGKQAVVSWDATKVPRGANSLPSLDLYDGSASLVAQLAKNFDPASGSVAFTVPEVTPGSYFVKIGPNSSPKFQITQDAVTYIPPITSPASDTVWKVGQKVPIIWDVSSVPKAAAPLAYIDLYTNSNNGGALFVARLASTVDIYTGTTTIVVPQVRTGSQYFIMLGKYGHSTSHFTINA